MKKIIALFVAIGLMLGLSACTDHGNEEVAKRAEAQSAKKDAARNTLEKTNLKERIKRQENATKVGYVYLLNFGKPFGYYVIKGKVSNAGSQLTPENEVIMDQGQYGGGNMVVDGAQDDGTYGEGDPGIFFFTSEGTMVETSIDYIYTDQPMDIDVPKLGG